MKQLIAWAIFAFLCSSFACMERCHESTSMPFVECQFIFEGNTGSNLLATKQLDVNAVEVRNSKTGNLVSFTYYKEGILLSFPEGEGDYTLTTQQKTFRFSVDVDRVNGECSPSYKLASFSIDGQVIAFIQPIFIFRL